MGELSDKYIRFDWAIKRLLRQKANFVVLEGFLTVFLGEPITILELLESEGNQLSADDKFNRVDIKALNSKGEIILIEVQNTRELYFLERILYGVAKAITEHIKLGQDYGEVKKVYSISILYFDLGIGSDYLYHGQNQFVGVHTGDRLQIRAKEQDAIVSRFPSEIFPEYILIRVNEFDKVAVTPLDEWMRYLKDGVIASDTTAPGLGEAREQLRYYSLSDTERRALGEAREQLRYYSLSDTERRAYDEHINDIMIQNDVLNTAKLEGRAEGLEQGRMEERLSTARNLKKLGIAPDTIVQATGLRLEEIEKL